ncbi:phosphoribosyl-ATP diphosphatase [Limnobacter humi]|uniref:Phosphoribosyl-ATP pyrophosphatase n=1 Tax=Limnobacter humi TaxID=1778671 RepID=A0ABT1WK58_9BURK|nr:phosphoribosyl-ATP diphosphatase [Limnobacter humi]MCQ8897471.1 phosphoribosyl-ATP diphosphatase [Limnobacter humi]
MTNTPNSTDLLARLTEVLEERKQADPEQSYVAKLHKKGQDAILKKIGEEACELVMASKDQDKTKVVYETADLWFHSLVALSWHGLTAADVLAELDRRMGLSGLAEKASRKEQ